MTATRRMVATATCAVVTAISWTSAADEPPKGKETTSEKETAQAQEPAPEPEDEARDWTIAAGIEAGMPGIGGAGVGASPLSMGGPTFLVERMLGDTVAVVGRLHGGWARNHQEIDDHQQQSEVESLGVGAAVGLRWILTPEAPLVVSTLALVEGGWAQTSFSSEQGRDDTYAWQAAAALGLGLDRELVPGVGLRMDVAIVEAGYYTAHALWSAADPSAGTDQDQHLVGWFGGFALRPTFALRYSF